MFRIYDGRDYFYQWDVGQKLIVIDEDCHEVHFCNKTSDVSLVCEIYDENGQRVVNVPNILLQTAYPITIFAYVKNADQSYTKHSHIFQVFARTKPADYVYTETAVKTLETIVNDWLTENPPKAGHTPIKGVDYYTEADKAEIKLEV